MVSVVTMRDRFATANIEGFSPSMKLILNILENNGPLTQKEITKVTRLPTRTVRYALTRLKQENILQESEYFQDARQCLYQIKCQMHACDIDNPAQIS